MKKYSTLLAAVILLLTKTTAQSVGINNNSPHASAALDVTSTTKGVLIPRLTQAQRLAIASPAKGLLVFDSTSNSFWYRNGTGWQELGSGGNSSNAWSLTGNSGTDTAVNFLGTTDNQPLLFKVNNGISGKIDFNYNTGFGYLTLRVNTSLNNSAFGYKALYSNTSGNGNTANGNSALYSNTTGNGNTANGNAALYTNTTGYSNTANGSNALSSNTTGNSNTANGSGALSSNTSGNKNTAVGYSVLASNTMGTNNTASGVSALDSNNIGSYNTAFGVLALGFNISGSYNTGLGYHANVSYSDLSNATAIGYNATVDASNKVRVGNAAVTSIGGQVGWTTFSDGRYKKNIKEDVPGLAFINSLRPVTYTVDLKSLIEYFNQNRKQALGKANEKLNTEMASAEEEGSKIVHTGFVAQEVEAAAKKLNYEFSGVDKPADLDGTYGLRYDDFVVPLVKAVQELAKKNDELEKRLAKLEAVLAAQSK